MKPARARQLVDDLRTGYRISIRRACEVVCFDRSTYHYRHRRPEQASLRKRIRELSEVRVRYGYRRIHVLLRRQVLSEVAPVGRCDKLSPVQWE